MTLLKYVIANDIRLHKFIAKYSGPENRRLKSLFVWRGANNGSFELKLIRNRAKISEALDHKAGKML